MALFALIPDNDTSFNFLVSILYTQLFQQLFYLADHKYGGSLPVPVHFLMDEFSNVSLPEDFSKILAVMRSRNVYVSIILQNVAALKALFEKEIRPFLKVEPLQGSRPRQKQLYLQLRRVPLSRRQRNIDPQADLGILPRQIHHRHQHLRQIIRAKRQLQHELSDQRQRASDAGRSAYAGQPLRPFVYPW